MSRLGRSLPFRHVVLPRTSASTATLPFASCASVSVTTLAITSGVAQIVPDACASVSTTGLSLAAPTRIPLASSASTSATALSLALSGFIPFDSCASVSSTAYNITAPGVIGHITSAFAVGARSTGLTSLSCTPQNTGDVVFVVVSQPVASGVPPQVNSLSDTAGLLGTFVKVIRGVRSGFGAVDIWMATVIGATVNGSAGATTINVVFASSVAAITEEITADSFSAAGGGPTSWGLVASGFLNNGSGVSCTMPTLTTDLVHNLQMYFGYALMTHTATGGVSSGFQEETTLGNNAIVFKSVLAENTAYAPGVAQSAGGINLTVAGVISASAVASLIPDACASVSATGLSLAAPLPLATSASASATALAVLSNIGLPLAASASVSATALGLQPYITPAACASVSATVLTVSLPHIIVPDMSASLSVTSLAIRTPAFPVFGRASSVSATINFVSPPQPPHVTLLPMDPISATGGKFNAAVDGRGASTVVYFMYGSPAMDTLAGPFPASAGVTADVSGAVENLEPGTTYLFNVLAINAYGTALGIPSTFTTPNYPDGPAYSLSPPFRARGGHATMVAGSYQNGQTLDVNAVLQSDDINYYQPDDIVISAAFAQMNAKYPGLFVVLPQNPLNVPPVLIQPVFTGTVACASQSSASLHIQAGSGAPSLALARSQSVSNTALAVRQPGRLVLSSVNAASTTGLSVTTPSLSSGDVTVWTPTSGFVPLTDNAALTLVVPAPEQRGGNTVNGSTNRCPSGTAVGPGVATSGTPDVGNYAQLGDPNFYVPTPAEITAFLAAKGTDGILNSARPYLNKVTGNPGMTLTTEELMQFYSHKWGIPTDWIRALCVIASNWFQTAINGETTLTTSLVNNVAASFAAAPSYARLNDGKNNGIYTKLGITQVKQYLINSGTGVQGGWPGTEPLRWKSTAFALDFCCAIIRIFYDNPSGQGLTWGGSTYVTGESQGRGVDQYTGTAAQWAAMAAWFIFFPYNAAAAGPVGSQPNFAVQMQNVIGSSGATPGSAGPRPWLTASFGSTTPQPIGVGGSWDCYLDEEFSGGALDTSIWNTGWFGTGVTAGVDAPDELECYDPLQVALSPVGSAPNNTMSLKLITKAQTVGGTSYPYTSALINTYNKFNLTPPVFIEARILFPATDLGVVLNWPSLFLDSYDWPSQGEIDIAECLGGVIQFNFHYGSLALPQQAGPFTPDGGGNFGSIFHTFGCYWQANSITYFYDGVQQSHSVVNNVTTAPMYIVLAHATDNGVFGGPTVSPSTMQVDYVRVYKPRFSATTGPINLSLPVVTGNLSVGSALSTTDGQWVGAQSFTYMWLREGVNIPGATQRTHVLTSADSGHFMSCRVIANDGNGTLSPLSSVPIGPVT